MNVVASVNSGNIVIDVANLQKLTALINTSIDQSLTAGFSSVEHSIKENIKKYMKGFRHLVQCHCVLPQFRKSSPVIFHKFPVFSIVDDNDSIEAKFVQCENCNVIHKVVDFCKSEIAIGKDESDTIVSIVDIKISLSENIIGVLERHNCHVSVWENVKFIFETELWGEYVKLGESIEESDISHKLLYIDGYDKARIQTEVRLNEIWNQK